MVKDHSDSEIGNPLPPHRLLLPINSKGSFICTIPQTGLCYTSRGAVAGTRNRHVRGLAVMKCCFRWPINSCDLI